MAIGRRGVMGLGAVGLGGVALGCANGLPPQAPTASPEDVARLLADLDHVLGELQSLEVGSLRSSDQEEALCLRLLRTLCLMGAYRDVPNSVWHEPQVEQRLAETLPRISATLSAARAHLVALMDTHGARIDDKLRSDSDVTMRILERIDEQAKRIDVPLEQRLHLRATTAQLSGRLRFEGAREVTTDLLAKYDRALASRKSVLGMVGDDTELPPAAVPPSPPVRTEPRPRGEEGESCREDVDCEEPLVCADGECKVHHGRKSERLVTTTRHVAIYGAIFLIPPLCGIGALILLNCLFMVIVAAGLAAGGD